MIHTGSIQLTEVERTNLESLLNPKNTKTNTAILEKLTNMCKILIIVNGHT